MSIGCKRGQELAHSDLDMEIVWSLGLGLLMALLVPVYLFFLLKRRISISNAGAISAAYGSVSAVTFVTAVSFLEAQHIEFGGHMVALMEAPSIIVGVLLISLFWKKSTNSVSFMEIMKYSITNSSVMLIRGNLVIGFLASEEQAGGIAPFTTDIFKGFLAVFLLDMGIVSGRRIGSLLENGWLHSGQTRVYMC